MSYLIPGIYNAAASPYGMSPGNGAAANASALSAAIHDCLNAGGGIVIIPSWDGVTNGTYKMATVTIPPTGSSGSQLLICGTGLGTTLEVQSSQDLFDVNGTNYVTFQDLIVQYDPGKTGTAFNFSGGMGHSLFRVNIQDCPNPVEFNSADQGYMLQCSVTYTSAFPASQSLTVVKINNSAEVMIMQCLFDFNGETNTSTDGTIGIAVGESSYLRVTDTQISDYQIGILVSTGGTAAAKGAAFQNVRVSALVNCVSLQNTFYDLSFVGCHFQASTNFTGTAGILVGSASYTNDKFDTVRFDSCGVTGFADGGYGLQVVAGRNVQITGGYYAGNGAAGIAITGSSETTPCEVQIIGANCIGPDNGSTPQQYGIYVEAVLDMQIVGVNCSGTGTGSNPGAGIYIAGDSVSDVRITNAVCVGSLYGNTSHQQYGIFAQSASGILINDSNLSGSAGTSSFGIYLDGVSDGQISDCDLTGNGTGGLYVIGSAATAQNIFVSNCNVSGYSAYDTAIQVGTNVSDLQITDSAGYNDQSVLVRAVAPTSSTVFYSYSFSSPYYGPVEFYASPGSATIYSIYVGGALTHLTSGSFFLRPRESGEVIWSGTGINVPNFIMIGK